MIRPEFANRFQLKFFFAALAAAVMALIVAGLFFATTTRRQLDERIEQTLVAEARLAATLMTLANASKKLDAASGAGRFAPAA